MGLGGTTWQLPRTSIPGGIKCWARGAVAEANEVVRGQVNSRTVCQAKEPGLSFEDDSHEGSFVREALSPATITPDRPSQTIPDLVPLPRAELLILILFFLSNNKSDRDGS